MSRAIQRNKLDLERNIPFCLGCKRYRFFRQTLKENPHLEEELWPEFIFKADKSAQPITILIFNENKQLAATLDENEKCHWKHHKEIYKDSLERIKNKHETT